MLTRQGRARRATKRAQSDDDLTHRTYGTLGAAVRGAIRLSHGYGDCEVGVYQVGERRWRIALPESMNGTQEDATVCFVTATGVAI